MAASDVDGGGRALGSDYTLGRSIGAGSMGRVFRGSCLSDGSSVAIKVLRDELASDPQVVARFIQERSILTALDDPHLVRVRDLVAEGDTLAIVMELVEGTDLRRFLQAAGGTLTPSQAAGLAAQVCEALKAAHAAGVIHRDVKPENVLVESHPSVWARLTDFGISRFADGPTLTRLTGLVGTPEYMAPELDDPTQVSPAVDVYSTGIMLYELCCGRTPFAGGGALSVLRRHAEADAPRPDGWPDQLWNLVAEMLSKEPLQRPSAAQVLVRLADLRPQLADAPALPAPAAEPDVASDDIPHPASAAASQVSQTNDTVSDRSDTRTLHSAATRLGRRARTDATSGADEPADCSQPWWNQHRRLLVGVGAGAVVLALVAGAFIVGSGGNTNSNGAFSSPLRYTFQSTVLANGVTSTRVWTVRMHGGAELEGELTVRNQTISPWTGDAIEVVPKSLAASVDSITFHPEPDSVLQRDPAVLYHLASLAPNASETVTYSIALRPGTADSQHLRRWVQDQQNTPIPTTTTTTTAVPPSTSPFPSGSVTPAPAACDASRSQFAVVNYNNLPIRTTPGPSTQVGSVPQGACVTVICTTVGSPVQGNTTWDRISFDDITGYSADQYINTGEGPDSPKAELPGC